MGSTPISRALSCTVLHGFIGVREGVNWWWVVNQLMLRWYSSRPKSHVDSTGRGYTSVRTRLVAPWGKRKPAQNTLSLPSVQARPSHAAVWLSVTVAQGFHWGEGGGQSAQFWSVPRHGAPPLFCPCPPNIGRHPYRGEGTVNRNLFVLVPRSGPPLL